MTITSPIDTTVDPAFNETLGERLGDPRSEYDRGQLPRQVFGPDELPDPASIPDHTLVYALPPFNYVCTPPNSPRSECVGQVLRVAHHTTGGGWSSTTWGVCQNVAHRSNLVAEAQRISGTTEVGALDPAGGVYLYATRFPPVTVAPLVDVDTLTPLQRRIYDYLASGGTQHLRQATLREMQAQGVFDEGRTDANVRAMVEGIVAADTRACDDGKRRFLEAVFLAEPEPEPEKREFFADQTTTYTMEDLLHRKVDAGDRFVSVPALIAAVLEAKERHELCDAGVQDFFDEFGIDATRTVRYGVDFKDPDGDRHQILSFEITVPIGADPIEDWADGDLDEVLNAAVDRYFTDLDIDHRQVTWHKRFDTYRFEED